MQSRKTTHSGRWKPSRLAAGLLTTTLVVTATGCDSLLDVENPNNVVESDLNTTFGASALVYGTVGLTADVVGEAALSTTTLSDELLWTGSQNWAGELDRGTLDNPSGRSDDLTNWLSEAVWSAEEAIRLTTEFEAPVRDRMLANFYSGILHLTIADNMEDFAFSNRTEVSAPIGEANMIGVYDTAIARLLTAEGLASGTDLIRVQAVLARAYWSRALWPQMQADPTNGGDPWIDDADANAYAQTVLDAIEGTDWTFDWAFSSATGDSPQGAWINSRGEFVFRPDYVQIGAGRKTVAPDTLDVDGDGDEDEAWVTLLDPVDGIPDQALQAEITSFIAARTYPNVTMVNEREMHLILAEAEVAQGTPALAVPYLNAVRTLKGGHTAYDPITDAPVTVEEVLMHERRVNLFNMASRRLYDMYRFGETSPQWGANSDAALNPGHVWVIGQTERISNCYIVDPGSC